MHVAIAARPDRTDALSSAAAASTILQGQGYRISQISLDSLTSEIDSSINLACIFGGDGTMLRAARIFSPYAIPLLGINLGRLGFLTSTDLDDLPAVLAAITQNAFSTVARSMLDARLLRGDKEIVRFLALNDVVVARGAAVRGIRTSVRIDNEPFTTYLADGIIVATATGSTAYAFSVGGPIILPGSNALMLVAIAPHLSFRNAIVLDGNQQLELTVEDTPARLSLDGQEELDLDIGDRILVERSPHVARLVRTEAMPPFLDLLRKKILKEA